jgi:hypothetical protein
MIFNIIVQLPRDKYDYVFKTISDFTLFSVKLTLFRSRINP